MKLRPLTFRKVSKRLVELEFQVVRQKGSHVFFRHSDGRTTIVPNHPGEEIGRGLLKKILRDIDTSVDDFFYKI